MEINSPGADHDSLIIPYSDVERDQLADLERRFDRRESWPDDRSWNTPSIMLEALNYMSEQEHPPVVIANHPSRSMLIPGNYGLYDPAELRAWNDAAPNDAIGMQAHQDTRPRNWSNLLEEPTGHNPRWEDLIK